MENNGVDRKFEKKELCPGRNTPHFAWFNPMDSIHLATETMNPPDYQLPRY